MTQPGAWVEEAFTKLGEARLCCVDGTQYRYPTWKAKDAIGRERHRGHVEIWAGGLKTDKRGE